MDEGGVVQLVGMRGVLRLCQHTNMKCGRHLFSPNLFLDLSIFRDTCSPDGLTEGL